MKFPRKGITNLLLILVSVLLIRYVYNEKSFDVLLSHFKTIRFKWVALSFLCNFGTHFFRSYRWQLLMAPVGIQTSLFKVFLSEMVGLFTNLLIPRFGDMTRCTALNRLSQTPLSSALGTVISERLLDILVFASLTAVTLVLVNQETGQLFYKALFPNTYHMSNFSVYIIGAIAFVLTLLLIIGYTKRKVLQELDILMKIRSALVTFFQGVLSIRSVANPYQFVLSTVMIWVTNFGVTYFWFLALPSTQSLGFVAGLSILLMANLGLSAPVQGGVGVYHVLVRTTLVAFSLSQTDAMLYATLTHFSQLIFILVFGGTCTVATLLLQKRKEE